MAVRTKDELRTMQAAMFADQSTGAITPAVLRDFLDDVIDSLSAGISHFSATGVTYSAAAHTLSLGAPGYEGDTGTIVFWLAPDDLDYDESPLSLVVGGETRALLDINGDPVGAHQVTPRSLYASQVLYASGGQRRWKLTSVIEDRPPAPGPPWWYRWVENPGHQTPEQVRVLMSPTIMLAGTRVEPDVFSVELGASIPVNGWPGVYVPSIWLPLSPRITTVSFLAKWLEMDTGIVGGVEYTVVRNPTVLNRLFFQGQTLTLNR